MKTFNIRVARVFSEIGIKELKPTEILVQVVTQQETQTPPFALCIFFKEFQQALPISLSAYHLQVKLSYVFTPFCLELIGTVNSPLNKLFIVYASCGSTKRRKKEIKKKCLLLEGPSKFHFPNVYETDCLLHVPS